MPRRQLLLVVVGVAAGPLDPGSGLKGTLHYRPHQTYVNLIPDINAGKLVTNFDTLAGESHHVGTRAHYPRTSRTADTETDVAKRSTAREIGMMQLMYPVHASDSDGTAPPPNIFDNRCVSRRDVRRKYVNISATDLNGLVPSQFHTMMVTPTATSHGVPIVKQIEKL